jgi:probable F420-dependent oxidoreductase
LKLDASVPQVPLREIPGIAAAAELMGLDCLWTSETQHDPFLPCALIAEHTRTVHFGTAIAVAFARSPATIAQTAWDLASQSGGRFILGLGTQVKAHIERRFGMAWPDSVTGKLREQILAIRALWDSWQHNRKLKFRGSYYRLTLMSPLFNPGPISHPEIPIFIAGVNPGLISLAGELCDGLVVHPFHSPAYLREVVLPALGRGAEKSGRRRPEIQVSVSVFTATSDQEAESARSQIAFYASTPSYRPVMALHGWEETARLLSSHAARSEWDEMPQLITDEMLQTFCLVATSESLAADLRSRYTGLADRLGLYGPFVPGQRDETWRALTRAFAS